MPGSLADRNLLFGILALQMDFITRDQLIEAMNAWVLRKSNRLGEILVEKRYLAESKRALLEPLVESHVQGHDNDPQKSLAAMSSVSSIREQLKQVEDADLQESVGLLGANVDIATRRMSAGQSTSEGLRFEIKKFHARGGLGEVFVAHDKELNREVALKEIKLDRAYDQTSQARFLLEAEITGGLEHPGIVPVYGLGHYADGRPFYAMRFIKGESLYDRIKDFHANKSMSSSERNLALRDLLGRFLDVCDAVQYAHDRGVLHRDLKPGNVMLGRYGETLVKESQARV